MENPANPYNLIQGILLGIEEMKAGQLVSTYSNDSLKSQI